MAQTTDEVIDEILAEIDQDEKRWAETVQVGDLVDASDDGFYTFSGHQYKTKGKLYPVREVDIRTDRETGKVYSRTVIVNGDYQDPTSNRPENVWLGPSKVIMRNGEIVWESSLVKSARALLASDEPLDDEQRKSLQNMLYTATPNGESY